MKIPIVDQSVLLESYVNDFQTKMKERLRIRNSFFTVEYFINQQEIDLKQKFEQYRACFPKREEMEWKLQLHQKEHPQLAGLIHLFERLGINPEKMVCPISQQVMMNPCYLQECKHYFEESYIVLAVELHNQCPLCKQSVSI